MPTKRRPQEVYSGRPWDGRSGSPRDVQIGCLGDFLWVLDEDVLWTFLRLIFAGWEDTKH